MGCIRFKRAVVGKGMEEEVVVVGARRRGIKVSICVERMQEMRDDDTRRTGKLTGVSVLQTARPLLRASLSSRCSRSRLLLWREVDEGVASLDA